MAKSRNIVGTSTYQSLKRDIIFGKLTPSSKLKLDALRENYKVSMSTLRETLNRLASEGFVSALEQRGFFVAPVSKEDLIEIANLRVILECHALKMSIQNGDNEWEGNLVAAHHKLNLIEQKMLYGDNYQKETWKRYDSEFHLALISACGSKNLLSLHSILYDKYLRYQMIVLTYRGLEAVEEHRKVFETALERNVEQSSKILKKHIEKGLEHSLNTL